MNPTKALLVLAFAAIVCAQPLAAHAKIVCWKDKAGKVVGCGDTVPPEYLDSATNELDKRGVTRKSTVSAQEEARQRAQTEAAARAKAEADRRAADQKRQDNALVNTFTSVAEIDAKRDRELQALDAQLVQLRMSLKNATDHQKDANSRLEAAAKTKKGNVAALKDEATRAADDAKHVQASITAREQEKERVRVRYTEYKQRFSALRGGEKK